MKRHDKAAHDLHYTGAPLAKRHTHESRGAAVADQPPKPESQPPSLQFSIDDSVANGVYVNFANIIHNPAEFVIDFGRVVPGRTDVRVLSRVLTTPGPRQAAPERPRPERGSLREDLRRHPHRLRGAAARPARNPFGRIDRTSNKEITSDESANPLRPSPRPRPLPFARRPRRGGSARAEEVRCPRADARRSRGPHLRPGRDRREADRRLPEGVPGLRPPAPPRLRHERLRSLPRVQPRASQGQVLRRRSSTSSSPSSSTSRTATNASLLVRYDIDPHAEQPGIVILMPDARIIEVLAHGEMAALTRKGDAAVQEFFLARFLKTDK